LRAVPEACLGATLPYRSFYKIIVGYEAKEQAFGVISGNIDKCSMALAVFVVVGLQFGRNFAKIVDRVLARTVEPIGMTSHVFPNKG